MLAIENVLCPIDFSSASESEIRLARNVCAHFGSRLVLQHNIDSAADWSGKPTANGEDLEAAAAQRMRAALDELEDVPVEGRITRGAVEEVIPRLAREIPADLIVMATHAEHTDGHDSVTERIMRRTTSPVLTIHDDESARRGNDLFPLDGRVHRVVAAVGLTRRGHVTPEYAFALARSLPLELHLLHVESPAVNGVSEDHATPRRAKAKVASVREKFERMVPSALRERVVIHVSKGELIEQIVQLSTRLGAALIISGAPGTRRAWLRRSTSLGLLHGSPCPVLYIPNARAVVRSMNRREPRARQAIS